MAPESEQITCLVQSCSHPRLVMGDSFAHPALKKRRILIAEDDCVLQFMINMELEKAGFTVQRADNGKDAFDAALCEKPDLIITDLMMPVMSGIDLIKKIRMHEDLNGIPVIVISATLNEHLVEQVMALGASKFIRKPLLPGSLADAADQLLS